MWNPSWVMWNPRWVIWDPWCIIVGLQMLQNPTCTTRDPHPVHDAEPQACCLVSHILWPYALPKDRNIILYGHLSTIMHTGDTQIVEIETPISIPVPLMLWKFNQKPPNTECHQTAPRCFQAMLVMAHFQSCWLPGYPEWEAPVSVEWPWWWNDQLWPRIEWAMPSPSKPMAKLRDAARFEFIPI